MDTVQRIYHDPGVPEIAFISIGVQQFVEFLFQVVDLIANCFIPAYKAHLHPSLRAIEHHGFAEQYRLFRKEVGMLIIAPYTWYPDQKAVSALPLHGNAGLPAAASQAVFTVQQFEYGDVEKFKAPAGRTLICNGDTRVYQHFTHLS